MKQTRTKPFKFTADMAEAWRKVKKEEDGSFTMQDMLDVYRERSDYASMTQRFVNGTDL